MPSPSARTGRSERLNALRRQLILDAAQRVFERDGLEKTTIRAIAAEAGCTTGAIYPWFAGKETIYGALLEESLQRLHACLSEAAATGDARTAARSAIHAFFGYYAERRTDFSLGMYLFQGLGPRGLGRDMDERLNARLRRLGVQVIDAQTAKLLSSFDAPAPAIPAGLPDYYTEGNRPNFGFPGDLMWVHQQRLIRIAPHFVSIWSMDGSRVAEFVVPA